MAEQKIIAAEKMMEIMNDRFLSEETIDYYGEELVVKNTIPFEIFCIIVRQVSNICFNKDTGEYMPENLDYAVRLCVIDSYTNIDLPESTEEKYQLIYRTDLWETVMPYINREQFNSLVSAIRNAIDVRNEANRALFDRDINMVLEQINSLGEQVNGMFANITEDDMRALVNAIGKNGIDEGKIVKAVVEEQNRIRGAEKDGEVIPFPATEDNVDSKDGE